jgi:hypothetical protein
MSAQQSINQLPAAGPITGSEAVPIVQNGVTVQTTTGAISASPSQTQTFLTVSQELTLNNSRYLSTGSGLGLTDGGAESFYRISFTGTALSLETAGGGIIVKDSSSTVVSRSIAVSGNGLSVSNANGTGGNPTLALDGVAASVANLNGTGILALNSTGTAVAGRNITGTTSQISVANGNGASGNPTIAIADNPVLPGTGSVTVPIGNNSQRPLGSNGEFRYNTDLMAFEGYANGGWTTFGSGGGGGGAVSSFSAGSTGLTPFAPTTGSIVLAGVLNVPSGGTGVNSLTGYVFGNGSSAMTASSTIPTSDLSGTISNAQLANSSVTINGTTISLGSSGTVSATTTNALTFGTGFNAGSFNGSAATTINLANTAVTAASYGSASKTLTATVNAQGQLTALADTNIAITNTQVSGLGTMSTQNANNVTISGGSINGTAIGATTAAAGTFTSVAMTSGTISTLPTSNNDIVNKEYADSIAAGLNYHQPVQYATTAGLPAYTYNNGASGVGATITATANGTLSLGGGSPTATQRVLVKDETGGSAAYNGVYVVTSAGSPSLPFILTRATDYDTSGSGTNEIDQGDYMLVISGTLASTAWVQQTALPIIVGTTPLVFLQFNAPITYTAGTGLSESPAYTFNIANTGVSAASYGTASQVPTLGINAQGQITSASNTSIAIAASQVTSGTFGNSMLTNSSVTVNGTAISLGASGTITAVNPNALTIGTGLSGTSYNGSSAVTVALANTTVAAATYGSASQVPVFAVNAQGQLTSVTNTSIAIAAGAVSGLAASATTDTTNAANISSGTLPSGRLSGSYTGITGVGTLTAGTWNASTIGYAYGGTGLTAAPTNGQLAIGNGSGYSLATLTAGTNISITNSAGGITISSTGSGSGSVTSVAMSVPSFLTVTGSPITTSGTLAVSYSGTALPVGNGGSGATTLTGYLYGNGTSAFTASTTIPNTAITGLGTMSTQNANGVAITGGTINGTSVGATTADTVRGTTITATTQFTGSGAGLTSIPNSATTATSANTASAIVARDASGNFTAGTITAALSGNATTATTATTATNIAGGSAGSLPYQTSASTTTLLAAGTNGYVLTLSGGLPTWAAATGGVTQIVAGTNVTISPAGGTGVVTINSGTGGSYTRTSFTATAGQTVFAVTYAVGYLQVYVNGVLLATSDYTATSGTDFTLNVACALGDIVEALVIATSISTTGITTGKSIAMAMIFGY